VLLFTVVVFVVLTGTFWVVVVVVCDCSDACGATESAGNQIAHPAAPRMPIKEVRATYTAAVFILFFTASI
jgi:hypothetical protein